MPSIFTDTVADRAITAHRVRAQVAMASFETRTKAGFDWSTKSEPHAWRQARMIKNHPEITGLMVIDPMTKWKVLLAVALQTAMAIWATTMPTWAWLLVAYTAGGCINHSMTLAMHEISHNLAFKHNVFLNHVIGVISNLPLGIPAFGMFKRYHAEHHHYQGEDGVDTDVPTVFESKLFFGLPGKFIWMVLQPVWYALRPIMILPKGIDTLVAFNVAAQIAYNFGLYWVTGNNLAAPGFLIMSTLLAMGLHPMAGHFIAEHYTFVEHQETYSYYGPLNWFSFNVGYHNEHHDFANIPGSNLPALRATAPEEYDDMPMYHSWAMVVFAYIISPTMGPWSRVVRDTLEEEEKKELLGASRAAAAAAAAAASAVKAPEVDRFVDHLGEDPNAFDDAPQRKVVATPDEAEEQKEAPEQEEEEPRRRSRRRSVSRR